MIDAGRLTGRMLVGAVLAAVLAASTAGCVSTNSTVGGGLPVLGPDERVDGAPVSFEGVVRIGSQGCLMVSVSEPAGDAADRWAVWPRDAELIVGHDLEAGNGALVDGQRYVKGDPITGTGRLVALEALPGGGKGGGYFRSRGTYCDALDGGVLVMDDIQPSVGATSPG